MKYLNNISKILTVSLFLFFTGNIYSQDYNTAIGVRGGGTSGITVKHFTSESNAIEGILGFGPHFFSVTGLLEKHKRAFDAEGLNWYYGFGGHISFYDDRWGYDSGYRGVYRNYGGAALGIGVDGIVGLEYKIPPIPVAVSLDVKPFVEVNTEGGVGFDPDPGLGIKVVF